jgi:sugar O-acyltransferase (sialic acid O-acetyltransferase NeuD family)
MIKDNLIIFGASGHAGVIKEEAIKTGFFNNILFFDDNKTTGPFGEKVQGGATDLMKVENDYSIIIGIGNNHIRKEIFLKLEYINHLEFTNVVSAQAMVSPSANLGIGNLFVCGAIINHQVEIGNNCIINSAAVIEHNSVIGSHSHIGPGAKLAGGVIISECVFIGMGACILPGIRIGAGSTIGAGSVITRDVGEAETVVGIPGKRIK